MNFIGEIRNGVLVGVLWLACWLTALGQPACHARNVILVIGDGMGLAQVAYLMNSVRKPIVLERFPVIGLQKTESASNLITDSGAAATAMSCGVKTYNSAIGVTMDTVPCRSIFEDAQAAGKRTGVVVTSSIVHATPAAFLAHQPLRGFFEQIAGDIADSGVDYFVGGGLVYFTDRYVDHRNLVAEMQSKGYTISSQDLESFRSFSREVKPKMAYFTAEVEPPPFTEGREPLAKYVTHALQVLSTYETNGFVLMVEASQVDFAGHREDKQYLLSEMKDMNNAMEVIYQFAAGRDDTLVIVTADHETGLLGITSSVPGKRVHVDYRTKNHSSIMVPVYAYGPCAKTFSGIYENTAIHDKMMAVLGLDSTGK